MREFVLSTLGKEIKKVREQRRQTLQEVACQAKVSKGLLSKIENGRTIPSLPVLISIIKSLKTDMGDFFAKIEQNHLDGIIHIPQNEYVPFEKEAALGFLYRHILSNNMGKQAFEVVILELKPDSYRESVTTDAWEYKYMLEGVVEYRIGEKVIQFKKGESLLFDGRIPHVPVNKSAKKAKMLVIYLYMTDN